jgi:hypothetical protein
MNCTKNHILLILRIRIYPVNYYLIMLKDVKVPQDNRQPTYGIAPKDSENGEIMSTIITADTHHNQETFKMSKNDSHGHT